LPRFDGHTGRGLQYPGDATTQVVKVGMAPDYRGAMLRAFGAAGPAASTGGCAWGGLRGMSLVDETMEAGVIRWLLDTPRGLRRGGRRGGAP